MSNTSDIAVSLIDAQTPGSTPNLRAAVLFEVVSEFCRDTLQTQPPTDYTTDPGGWMTDDQWVEHHTTIISGVLARFYVMPNKPWSNATIAQAHASLYAMGVARGREHFATTQTATTGLSRIMMNVRMLVPQIRDPAIYQELFNVIDTFTRNVLQTTPPDYNAAPSAWLSDDMYKTYFRLIMAGVLARIYGQSSKPWTDASGQAYQSGLWATEVVTAREDLQATDAVDPTDRLMSSLRAQLPGIKDSAIYPELFNVINEACREYFVWIDTIPYKLTLNRQSFKIAPEGCDVVRVGDMSHATITCDIHYDPVQQAVSIRDTITEAMLADPLYIRMSLAPLVTSKSEDASNWIPFDLWGRLHNLLTEGCLHKLMIQPAKPWSDAKLGAVHGQQYRRLLVAAMYEVRSQGTIPQRQNWTFPRFTQ